MVRCASLGDGWASEAALATPVQRAGSHGLGCVGTRDGLRALGWVGGHGGAAERAGWDAGHNLVAERTGVGAAAPGAGEMALYYIRGLGDAVRPVKGLKCGKFAGPIVR
jgi:hypothetical protein